MIEKKKLTILWLDDVRNPLNYFNNKSSSKALLRNKSFYDELKNQYDVSFDWVKNFDEFKNYILKNGIPEFVSFDRDLGTKPITGYDCAKWLKDYCNKNGISLPKFYVHSANPNGQREINTCLNNTMDENVIKITKEDITKMVGSVLSRLNEDAYINQYNTKKKTANLTYNKGDRGYKKNLNRKDYLKTDLMDTNNADTYEVKLKGGLTSYNITSINGTEVMHYFKNYFDKKNDPSVKVVDAETNTEEKYKIEMQQNEFNNFKSQFFKKVDFVISYAINEFRQQNNNLNFDKVSIYPVPSKSRFNVEMAKEMLPFKFTGIENGTQLINTELFKKDLKNLQKDEEFIENNKNYFTSNRSYKTKETHEQALETMINKMVAFNSYIDSHVGYVNHLIKNKIMPTYNSAKYRVRHCGMPVENIGRLLANYYKSLAETYHQIWLRSSYFNSYTKELQRIRTDCQFHSIQYSKKPTNKLNSDEIWNYVKPYLKGVRLSDGTPIKKVNICQIEKNPFEIKKYVNDIRMGLKNYFSTNYDVAEQELNKIKNTVFVIFDDNISGGATLSDICLQAKKLGIEWIIPITFGRMDESWVESMVVINKPEGGKFNTDFEYEV